MAPKTMYGNFPQFEQMARGSTSSVGRPYKIDLGARTNSFFSLSKENIMASQIKIKNDL